MREFLILPYCYPYAHAVFRVQITALVTLTDFLNYLLEDASRCSASEVGELISGISLVSVSADAKYV